MGTLFIVATPIGNMSDISKRAVEVLSKVDVVFAESTRTASKLYQLLGLPPKKLIQFNEHTEEKLISEILKLLVTGGDIALISESGTPLISDPGFKLVRACRNNNIKVSPIPGANAAIATISASGLPTDKFLFLGFLPKSQGKKAKLLNKIKTIRENLPIVLIIYENPNRLEKSLREIRDVLGNMDACIGLEVTKKFESFEIGKLDSVILKLKGKKIKGEVTIVIG